MVSGQQKHALGPFSYVLEYNREDLGLLVSRGRKVIHCFRVEVSHRARPMGMGVPADDTVAAGRMVWATSL